MTVRLEFWSFGLEISDPWVWHLTIRRACIDTEARVGSAVYCIYDYSMDLGRGSGAFGRYGTQKVAVCCRPLGPHVLLYAHVPPLAPGAPKKNGIYN